MKSFVFAAVLTVATSAFAGSLPQWPTLNFEGKNVSINKVCVASEYFRTINAVKFCAETAVTAQYACRMIDNSYGDVSEPPTEVCRKIASATEVMSNEVLKQTRSCVRFEEAVLKTGKTMETTVCTKWTPDTEASTGECLKYETKTVAIPTKYTVSLVSDGSGDSSPGEIVSSMTFRIPACN